MKTIRRKEKETLEGNQSVPSRYAVSGQSAMRIDLLLCCDGAMMKKLERRTDPDLEGTAGAAKSFDNAILLTAWKKAALPIRNPEIRIYFLYIFVVR